MGIETLSDLFSQSLRGALYAELQIQRTLPAIIRVTTDGKIRGVFEDSLDETNKHSERLKRVFFLLGTAPETARCAVIDELIDEAEDRVSEIQFPKIRDVALIASVQAIKQFEITRLGTLCLWAEWLQCEQIAAILQQTIHEEKAMDLKLFQLCEAIFGLQASN